MLLRGLIIALIHEDNFPQALGIFRQALEVIRLVENVPAKSGIQGAFPNNSYLSIHLFSFLRMSPSGFWPLHSMQVSPLLSKLPAVSSLLGSLDTSLLSYRCESDLARDYCEISMQLLDHLHGKPCVSGLDKQVRENSFFFLLFLLLHHSLGAYHPSTVRFL